MEMNLAHIAVGMRRRREYLGLSQPTVAKRAGTSDANISKLERNGAKRGVRETLDTIARALRLRGWQDLQAIGAGDMEDDVDVPGLNAADDPATAAPKLLLPVYAWGAAGDPRSVDFSPDPVDYIDPEAVARPYVGPQCFALQIKGTSMINSDIPDGATVWIDPGGRYKHGQPVAVHIPGEGVVVRVFAGEELRSDGPGGPAPVTYKQAQIIGPVVWVAGHPPKTRRVT